MSEEELKEFEEYIEKLDIDLASAEKFGSTLLAIGYVFFIYSTNLDIADILKTNDTGLKPSSIIVQGAILVLIGYVVLWIVAEKRHSEEKLKFNVTGEGYERIAVLHQITYTYLAAIWVNLIRVNGFVKLDEIIRSGEVIV